MEPAKAKVRQVPEARIKTVEGSVHIELPLANGLEHYLEARLLEDIGREVALKLAEFGRIKKEQITPLLSKHSFSFEIIVPPTPGNPP